MRGTEINCGAEAVDEYGTPIAGLYAAGLDAGGLHPESCSMRDTSGKASAFAMISGRMAGEHATEPLKEG